MTGLDLRPLSIGEILDRTFSLYRRHFLLFIGIAGIPHLLTLAVGLLQVWFGHAPLVVDRRSGGLVFHQSTGLTLVFQILAVIVGIIVYLWSQGATVFAVTELYLGRQTSISACLRRVWGKLASLFGVVVLNGLAILGALLLFIIPGVYVACRLLVCVPSALIEGRGPRDSLSRSWHLTREYAGRAFVLYLLYLVLAMGIGLLLGLPIGFALAAARNDPAALRTWLAAQQVLNVVVTALVTPIILIGTSVFYFDLRVRQEAFDLQFMMDPTSERIAPTGGSATSILS